MNIVTDLFDDSRDAARRRTVAAQRATQDSPLDPAQNATSQASCMATTPPTKSPHSSQCSNYRPTTATTPKQPTQ